MDDGFKAFNQSVPSQHQLAFWDAIFYTDIKYEVKYTLILVA